MRKSLSRQKRKSSAAHTRELSFEERLNRELDEFDKGTKAERIYAEAWELSVKYKVMSKVPDIEATIRDLLIKRGFADEVIFCREELKIEIKLDGESYPFLQGET